MLGASGSSINGTAGFGPVPDEHSSVFAPGTLGTNQDYLFFLATGTAGNPGIGVTVLSGSAGVGKSGQWVLDIPKAHGYGNYSSGFGQVFIPAMKGGVCPTVPDGNPAHQDQTFDLHYASPGSVMIDPTGPAGFAVDDLRGDECLHRHHRRGCSQHDQRLHLVGGRGSER